MPMFLRHLRYSLHTLSRSPGYTLMCLAVLALGIGANAAIFSVLDTVVLNALPYPDTERLVFAWERLPSMPAPFDKRMQVSYRSFQEWRRQNQVFSEMAAFRSMPLRQNAVEDGVQVTTCFASAALFPMLGARARLGRIFTPAEETAGSDHVAVLSDGYFDRRFHRDPGVIGKAVTLDGTPYTVIGVLPQTFFLPSTFEGFDQVKPDVWVPLSRIPLPAEEDRAATLYVAARMKPGVSLEQARTEMAGIEGRLLKADPQMNPAMTTAVFSFQTEDSGREVHGALYMLMGAVGFLLLIACANLANLTLARATLRSREIAVRLALGATRGRIMAQLVTESLMVSLGGAALGLLSAHWSIRLMLSLKPEGIQRPELIGIHLPVFLFAAGGTLFTTVLIGLLPAAAASRMDLNTALKSGSWGASAARMRSRQFLITFEVALALVLVVGAGLLIRSFREIVTVGIGFHTERITLADVELPSSRYPDDASRSRFFHAWLDRAAGRLGMTSVGIVDNPPLHRISMSNFYIAGRPDPPPAELPIADKLHASPGYFQAVDLRLEAGRWFTDRDLALTEKGGNAVVIVNRAFVRQFFPKENPIGQRLLDSSKKQASEIVGVVSDWRPMGVEKGVRPGIFWPDLRLPAATVVVKSSAPPQALADEIRNSLWAIDKDLPAATVLPMQHYVDEWLSSRKFMTLLLGFFALLALVLGMMGIYGILSNLVASRTREIGIRMAIGASPSEIGSLVLRQSMVPVAVGVAAGVAGSLVLSRFVETLLFQVRPRDPVTLIVASLSILLIAPVAISLPLLRATRVDCTVALRQD
jgi:putative ABC transport system permease protein